MRISSREKALLAVLAALLIMVGYYYLMYLPLEGKTDSANKLLEEKRAEKLVVESLIAKEDDIAKDIEILEQMVESKAEAYYAELSQDEMILALLTLSDNYNMKLTQMQLIEDELLEDGIMSLSIDLGIRSEYANYVGFLKQVEANNKRILAKQSSIISDYEGQLSGKVRLEFNTIPGLAEYVTEDNPLLKLSDVEYSYIANPFLPYDDFIIPSNEETTEYPTEDGTDGADGTDPDYETYRPRVQIYGFEDGAYFFVGSDPDTDGDVTRSRIHVAGGYAADMQFDFIKPRAVNEANLVFDTRSVMIEKSATHLGMWMYAYSASDHVVGAVLIDATGKEYRLDFASAVDWVGWKQIEAELPATVNYPCKVQRIYVVGNGYEQKVSGKYLFDQLQISYPVE